VAVVRAWHRPDARRSTGDGGLSIGVAMALFHKESGANRGLAALGFAPDGVGIARVTRVRDAPPVLDACEFVRVPGAGGWGDALAKLSRRHRLGRRDCSIVIEEGAYSLLLVEAPDVPPEELRAAVRWRVRDMIDFHIDDAVIDVFDLPGQKAGGRARMMYVVAARVPRVGEKAELARAAGLRLQVIDIPELAQRNVAACLPEDVAGVALLYLSARSGLITLTRQRTLYLARRIDVGLGEVITEGASAADRKVREWLDTLVVEVQRSLDYYERSFAQPPVANLVIAPLAHMVDGIAGYLGEQLGIAVRLLDLNEIIDSKVPIEVELQAHCFPVIGAALRSEERSL